MNKIKKIDEFILEDIDNSNYQNIQTKVNLKKLNSGVYLCAIIIKSNSGFTYCTNSETVSEVKALQIAKEFNLIIEE